MSPSDRMARGARVKQLMEDETFSAALLAVDHEIRDAIVKTGHEDQKIREALYHEYHALKRVISKLKQWQADGAIAGQDA